MSNFNKVMLMGRLTRDIELRFTASNMAVANFGLAINRRFRTKEGQDQDETTFVDCEAWGRTAEVMKEYLAKGRPVFVEGRLKLDQWEDKEGGKRSRLKVVVENFCFVDSRGERVDRGEGGAQGEGGSSGGGGGGGGSRRVPAPAGAPLDEPHHPVGEDDIPF